MAFKIKLNPCPFCGGGTKFYKKYGEYIVGINCKNRKCGAVICFYKNGVNIYWDELEALADIFNERQK